MNSVTEHLSTEQLRAYRNDALPLAERREISRHLLQCKICLAALPLPTREQFLAAVFEEKAVVDSEETAERSNKIGFIESFFKNSSVLAWSGAMVVIVLGFTFSIWLTAILSFPSQTEVAQSNEIKAGSAVQSENDDQTSLRHNLSEVKAGDSSPAIVTAQSKPTNNLKTARDIGQRSESKNTAQPDANKKNKSDNLSETKPIVAPTRGVSAPCNADIGIKTGINAAENKIVLKWGKIPNATQYHLYVSDDDEILIDEYETERENSYVLEKTLDPKKTYNWKLVVTLTNGQTIIGEARKFSVRNYQTKFKKTKSKLAVRCENEQ